MACNIYNFEIFQGDIDAAIDNLSQILENTVFFDYVDCNGNTISSGITSAGLYEICLESFIESYYYSNNMPRSASTSGSTGPFCLTPTPTETEEPDPTPTPTETEEPDPTPTPTETEEPDPTPTPTETEPIIFVTPTETEEPDPTPTPTETEEPDPTPTPTETEPIIFVTPTETEEPDPTPTPSATTPVPTPSSTTPAPTTSVPGPPLPTPTSLQPRVYPDIPLTNVVSNPTPRNLSITFDNVTSAIGYQLFVKTPIRFKDGLFIDGIFYSIASGVVSSLPITVRYGRNRLYPNRIYVARIAVYFSNGTLSFSEPFVFNTNIRRRNS